MRSGKWKLHMPHTYRTLGTEPPGKDGKPANYKQARTPTALYNLAVDVGEKTNVADKHPDIVERLRKLAQVMREDLGDSLTKTEGKGRRRERQRAANLTEAQRRGTEKRTRGKTALGEAKPCLLLSAFLCLSLCPLCLYG